MAFAKTLFIASMAVACALGRAEAQSGPPPLPPGECPRQPSPLRGRDRVVTPGDEQQALDFIRSLDTMQVDRVLALKTRRPRTYRAMIMRSLNMQRHAQMMRNRGNDEGYQRSRRLFREILQTREEMDGLMMQYRRATAESERRELRARFVEAAGRIFDAQTALGSLQIAQMKEELGHLQLQVDQRQNRRERVIQRQVEMMLAADDDLD